MKEDQKAKILDDGEQLLWRSAPAKFETLDAVYKPKLIRSIVIALIAAAIVVGGYIALALKNDAGVKPVMIIIIVALAFISPIGFFSDAKKLRKSFEYAVTDQRLLIITENVSGMAFTAIKEAKLITDKAGVTSLVCGKRALGSKPEKLRGLAASGCHLTDDGECDCLVFYSVSDPARLKKILSPYLDI